MVYTNIYGDLGMVYGIVLPALFKMGIQNHILMINKT